MGKLELYLLKQTSVMVAIVFLSIAGLLLVTGIADEAARKVNETYRLADAVQYKLAMLPNDTYDYIGVIVMLGTLITVASFNKHQELTTIQLSAQSALSLILRLLTPALILLPILFFTGEWIGPKLVQTAERERAELLGETSPTLRGQWYRAGNEFINVEFIGQDELVGISRFRLDDNHELIEANYSQQARYENGAWVLNETQSIRNINQQLSQTTTVQTQWQNALFTPELIEKLVIEPEYLSLSELAQQIMFREDAGTLTPELERTFWSRAFFPLQYLALMLIALSFSFGSFRQKTVGDAAFKALVTGVLVGLITNTASAGLMILSIPAAYAVIITYLALLVIAGYLTSKSY